MNWEILKKKKVIMAIVALIFLIARTYGIGDKQLSDLQVIVDTAVGVLVLIGIVTDTDKII